MASQNEKLIPEDGGVYLNRGPVNPVADINAAHSMAIAGAKARQRHSVAVEAVEMAQLQHFGEFPSPEVQQVAKADPDRLADQAEERERLNIARHDITKGKALLNLVELQPPIESTPQIDVQQADHKVSVKET